MFTRSHRSLLFVIVLLFVLAACGTPTPAPTALPTEPPTSTPVPPTATAVPPTATSVPPTATPVPGTTTKNAAANTLYLPIVGRGGTPQ